MGDAQVRIEVNQIGEYVQRNSCARRFKLDLNGRELAREVPFYSRVLNSLNPVLQEMGARKEEEWESSLKEDGLADLNDRDPGGPLDKMSWTNFVELLQDGSLKGKDLYVREVEISGTFGRFYVSGRCDFLAITWKDNVPSLRVVECKASRKDKSYHRLQLASYLLMIQAQIEGNGLSVAGVLVDPKNIEGVVVRLDEDGRSEQRIMKLPPVDLETEKEDIRRLLGETGELNRIVDAEIDDLSYRLDSKCDSCVFSVNCLPESARKRRLELIGADTSTIRTLHDHGVTTIDALASLDPNGEQAAQIRVVPGFSENIERLVTIAKARSSTLPGKGPQDHQVIPFPHASSGCLPSHIVNEQPLVRIFMCVDYDYSEDRIAALSAHVTKSDWLISTRFRDGQEGKREPDPIPVEVAPAKGKPEREQESRPVSGRDVLFHKTTPWKGDYNADTRAEGELIQSFFVELIQAVRAVAGTEKAPLHFYFWTRGEVRSLLEGCSRCNSAMLQAFAELLGCRESLEQMIFTVMEDEVASKYATGWTGNGLVVTSSLSWFGRRYHWVRNVNGSRVSLSEVFEQDLFDYRARLALSSEGKWADDDDLRATKHLFEIRCRFHDSLPMPYLHAIWGTLPSPDRPNMKQGMRQSIKRYMRAADPALLTEYQRARVQAMRWVEERMVRKNYDISKVPVDLDGLDKFTLGVTNSARAAIDFLRLDHRVGMNDWLARMTLPPIDRVVVGDCLPVRDTVIKTEIKADGKKRTYLEGMMDLERFGEDRATFQDKFTLEEGSWARGVPCPEGPLVEQDLKSILYDGLNFIVKQIDFDTGKVVLDFMSTNPSRYLLLSRNPGDGVYVPLMTLDKSPSDFVSGRVDERLSVAGTAPAIRWFDLKTPEIPEIADLDHRSKALYQGILDHIEFNHNRLGDDQRKACMESMSSRVQLMQGPPGTGKTTTTAVAALMKASLMRRGGVMVLAANTHMAADRLNEAVNMIVTPFTEAVQRDGHVRAAPKFIVRSLKEIQKDPNYYKLLDGERQEGRLIVSGTTNEVIKMASRMNLLPSFSRSTNGFSIDSLIVDEASMMAMPHFLALASFVGADGTIMLAGDHRQLSPIVAHDWEMEDRPPVIKYQPYVSAYDAVKDLAEKSEAVTSRMIARSSLDLTYRLPEEITRLISGVYHRDGIDLRTSKKAERRTIVLTDNPWDSVWQTGGIFLVLHDENESKKTNKFEGDVLEMIMRASPSIDMDSTAVMTPHRAQRALLQRKLKEYHNLQVGLIDTVERLQGGERPTIIVSGTQSDPASISGAAEFILNLNRSNVIFSRAKDRLIVVCSSSLLDSVPADSEQYRSAYLWKRLRDICTLRLSNFSFEGHNVSILVPDSVSVKTVDGLDANEVSVKSISETTAAIAKIVPSVPLTKLDTPSVPKAERKGRSWAEIGPGPPPMTGIIVDGSNVARHDSIYGRADAEQLIAGYRDLRDRFGFKNIRILVGPGLFRDLGREKFREMERFFAEEEEKSRQKILHQAPAGVNDDRFTIGWALHDDLLILTNDCYRDHISEKPDLEYDIRTRLVKYMFQNKELVIAQWPDYRN